MDEGTSFEPWWERWPAWWLEQQHQVRAACPKGEFLPLDRASHVQRWRGLMQVGRQEWRLEILWGPGTPWLWPRFIPLDCYSIAHQLQDRSMCLAPPDAPEHGWSGVPDMLVWLERARTWFNGYATKGWAIPEMLWPLIAPQRPAPGYRPTGKPSPLLLLPPAWAKGPPAPMGHFRARVASARLSTEDGEGPDARADVDVLEVSRGLGVMVGWGDLNRDREGWTAGLEFVDDTWEEYEGIWLSPDTTPDEMLISGGGLQSPRLFRERGRQRECERLLEKMARRTRKTGRPCLHLMGFKVPWGGRILNWCCRWDVGPQEIPSWTEPPQDSDELESRLNQVISGVTSSLRAVAESFRTWPAIPLTDQRLESRRLAGRTTDMNEILSRAEVVLVGLGALGSEVAHLLAREGIGRFVLVDGDVLWPENVARHRADLSEVGQSKVEVVRRLITRANPKAEVTTIHTWLDDYAPRMRLARHSHPVLVLGMTAHEGAECLLEEFCERLSVPRLHAWLEMEGQVLRLFRVLPERDPTFLELETDPENPLPPLPRRPQVDLAEECSDLVLPGSASNIHAAANFVAQIALVLLGGRSTEGNHWLFAPTGVRHPDLAPELECLRRRFGVYETTILRKAG